MDSRKVVGTICVTVLVVGIAIGVTMYVRKKVITANYVPSNLAPDPQSVLNTKNNYLIWANGIAVYLLQNGNYDIAAQLFRQINASMAGAAQVPDMKGGQRNNTFFNAEQIHGSITIPNFPVYPDPSATYTTDPKVVFLNAAQIMAAVAHNYIQSNTYGQAIGSRQGYVRQALYAILNDPSENSIPQSAANLINIYNYAYTAQWGHQFDAVKSGSDTLTIVKFVTDAAIITAAIVLTVGSAGIATPVAFGAASAGIGAVQAIPNK